MCLKGFPEFKSISNGTITTYFLSQMGHESSFEGVSQGSKAPGRFLGKQQLPISERWPLWWKAQLWEEEVKREGAWPSQADLVKSTRFQWMADGQLARPRQGVGGGGGREAGHCKQ